MDLYEEFVGIVRSLQAAKIDFAVCRGFAMALHGHPRYTKDIDILVLAEDVDRAIEVAKSCEFVFDAGTMRFGADERYPQEMRRITKIVGREYLPLDLLVVGPHLRGVWDHKETYRFRGVEIPALSAAGLARMKRMAGRPQDLVDIEALGFRNDDPAIQPEM